jgi:hypothetical protein
MNYIVKVSWKKMFSNSECLGVFVFSENVLNQYKNFYTELVFENEKETTLEPYGNKTLALAIQASAQLK